MQGLLYGRENGKIDSKCLVITLVIVGCVNIHELCPANEDGMYVLAIMGCYKTVLRRKNKMYMDDHIFKVIRNYNYDLFRGNSNVSTYLGNHFKLYMTDIENAIKEDNPFLGDDFVSILVARIPLLKKICNQIVIVSETYRNGKIKEAYDKAYCLFELMSPYYLPRFSWEGSSGCFYRIRQGEFRIKDGKDSKTQKAEMFHIKDDLRNLIGAYRYSVSGFPCLYLSSDRELAWFECGMPRQFSYCQMRIEEDGKNALRLIDFSNRPIDLLSSIHIWLLNASKDKNEQEKIYNYFANYIITYPLAATCSLMVKQRDNKFVEEYVIPQMFMQWIRESNHFDGIRYKSSLHSNLVRGMGAINVALPVKKFRTDGLCENLTSKISISDIGYFDVNREFKKYDAYLDEIERFKNDLWADVFNSSFQGAYEWQLIEACEIVIKTYDALMDGDYQNSELIFSYIDCLNYYIASIYKNKKIIIEDCIKKAESEKNNSIDTTKIELHIETFYSLMEKVLHSHIVFHFDFENLANFEKI